MSTPGLAGMWARFAFCRGVAAKVSTMSPLQTRALIES
jgi:hypothetical protein